MPAEGTSAAIPAEDPHPRRRVAVKGGEGGGERAAEMAYVDIGRGPPVVFLHGNPTSSYLWRNVMPSIVETGYRCLAPDLIGMGESDKLPAGTQYTFFEHADYLDCWFDAVLPEGKLALVGHDWGGALGFHWAKRHPERVAAIAFMETIVCALTWDDWPEAARGVFQGMRSPKGEDLVLERNIFVEGILPNSILRELTATEHDTYRKPYLAGGETRRPVLSWPRHIPIEGQPPEMVEVVEASWRYLETDPVPKLFVDADPGSIHIGKARDLSRRLANLEEVTVRGLHFVQEDSPVEIGRAVADFLKRRNV